MCEIEEKDLNLDIKKLKEKLTDYDYIYFNNGKAKNLAYREYLQAYSLEKSKKQISCCDYYISKGILKNYLFFRAKRAFMTCDKKDFISFLNLNQLMVTKDYFLENLDKFKFAFRGSKIRFLNDKNTVFVSFPLIELRKIKTKNYEIMKKAFDFKFLYTLYSLRYHKKFLSPYLWRMLLTIPLGDYFILKAITKTMNSKDKQNKLKCFEVSNKHAK